MLVLIFTYLKTLLKQVNFISRLYVSLHNGVLTGIPVAADALFHKQLLHHQLLSQVLDSTLQPQHPGFVAVRVQGGGGDCGVVHMVGGQSDSDQTQEY